MAIGTVGEDSEAAGVNEDQFDNSADSAGAVFVY
jgi:hypothetical protein